MSKPILGPDGKPYRQQNVPTRRSDFLAQYDVSQTSSQNAEHWGQVGVGDANVAYDKARRQTTRDRARYETANNCHLRGMVSTKGNDVIGSVTLQMESGHEQLERDWEAWVEEVCLLEKLASMWTAGKLQDGEAIGLLQLNPMIEHQVKLDLMTIEPEQMGNPFSQADTTTMYDGIRHLNGSAYSYYIYDNHPDSYGGIGIENAAPPYTGSWYDKSRVIHVFRKNRLGQLRGASELGPALPLSAIVRRYTLATLSSAEVAASISLWLETDGMPEDEPAGIEQGAMAPIVRNQVITAPYRWKVHQLRAEQPVDTYDKFLRAIITQMGRAIGMPAALTYGDSSDYNMASGRLDYQDYIRDLNGQRSLYLEPQCLDKIFLAWLRFYLSERTGIGPLNFGRNEMRSLYPHCWSYRPVHHSDPEKQAKADVAMWEIGILSDADLLYRQNKNPQQHYAELEIQNQQRQRLGMKLPGQMPGMQTTPANGGQNDQQQTASTPAE